jgi:hypothetical protein
MKIIEVKPVRGGRKVFETLGVEPVFAGLNGRDQAIDYAKTGQGYSQGEIRVFNGAGEVVEMIPFDDRQKPL